MLSFTRRCFLKKSNISAALTRALNIVSNTDIPPNEPLTDFTNPEVRAKLEASLAKVNSECLDVPVVIGGKEYWTDDIKYQVAPHDHSQKVAKFCYANQELMELAIENSLIAREKWEAMPYDARARIVMRATSLLATKYRYDNLAACMIGQGKTAIQADIDVIAELVDFLKFGVHFGKQINDGPALRHPDNIINAVQSRGLEGFIAAICPFNFSAIGGNLATSPALMGNVVLWKPSNTALLSNYYFYKILQEAGMPDGVVQFVPCSGSVFGKTISESPDLAGITFTGSSATFNTIWKTVGENIANYKTYPKLVGETGGKNYHFLHPSGEVDCFVHGTIRAAYEYQGQKCSACARVYVPNTLWPEVKEKLQTELQKVKLGRADDWSSFLTAVIDKGSFDNIKSYIDHARESPDYDIISGGHCDDSTGYFITPTLIESKDPKGKLMEEEIFGPVATVYVYDADDMDGALDLVNTTSPYALTGAIFALDREWVLHASQKLRQTCGNFYVNEKSTGSVVAQQPFGGARKSGTNDKTGMGLYLQRWVSPMTIKENLAPLPHWSYPYMSQ